MNYNCDISFFKAHLLLSSGDNWTLDIVSYQNEIRSSLVLSMLQQMLSDDKTEDVRATVVRSLGVLTGFIDDIDKFKQVGLLMYFSD